VMPVSFLILFCCLRFNIGLILYMLVKVNINDFMRTIETSYLLCFLLFGLDGAISSMVEHSRCCELIVREETSVIKRMNW